MSSRWVVAATAACASLLLSGCILGLPDADPYSDGGSVPAAERQTLEAFVSDAMPRYMSIIEEVAMESGGVIADVGHSETQPCRSEVNGYEIRAVRFNLPLIEYEDMRRIVGEAAQRYGYLYTSGLWVQNDFRNDGSRRIYFTDNDGNSAEFKYTETGIEMSSYSSCLPTSHALNDPGQFTLPSVEEAFPGVHVTVSDNTNPDLHPLPTLTLGAQADPQPDAQSGAQSGS